MAGVHPKVRINQAREMMILKLQFEQLQREIAIDRRPLTETLAEMVAFCQEQHYDDPILNRDEPKNIYPPHKRQQFCPLI